MKRVDIILIIIVLCFIINIQPIQALLFTFEDDAQLKSWTILGGNWQITDDKNNKSKVLRGEGANEINIAIGDNSWTDYTVEFDSCGITDDIGIAFRLQDINSFIGFLVAPSLDLTEWFVKKNGAFDESVAKKNNKFGVNINEWHKYKLVVKGMEAQIFIDGKEPLNPLEIAKGFEKGGIGFRQWADTGHYDNVLITGPGIPRSPGEFSVSPKGNLANTWGWIKTSHGI